VNEWRKRFIDRCRTLGIADADIPRTKPSKALCKACDEGADHESHAIQGPEGQNLDAHAFQSHHDALIQRYQDVSRSRSPHHTDDKVQDVLVYLLSQFRRTGEGDALAPTVALDRLSGEIWVDDVWPVAAAPVEKAGDAEKPKAQGKGKKKAKESPEQGGDAGDGEKPKGEGAGA